jgi:sec-independent protein translocase protein TatB
MGGVEIVVIALIALIVVGPKDLPVLLRRLGKATAKVRGMAQEFRASFDEMARQSELDELRREVEALRSEHMRPLGDQFDQHMHDIGADLSAPPPLLDAPGYPPPEQLARQKPATKKPKAKRPAAKTAAPKPAPAAKPARATKTADKPAPKTRRRTKA